MLKECPKCHGIRADAKFCDRDGTKLVLFKKCPCGHSVAPIDKFCEECGKEIER